MGLILYIDRFVGVNRFDIVGVEGFDIIGVDGFDIVGNIL